MNDLMSMAGADHQQAAAHVSSLHVGVDFDMQILCTPQAVKFGVQHYEGLLRLGS